MTSDVQLGPPHVEPQPEHVQLQRLVGEWRVDSRMSMGPGQPEMTLSGTQSVRALGPLWVIGEGRDATGGGEPDSIITLGFDPNSGRFTGTFISSMGTKLWVYDGEMDADGRTLSLYADGPPMTGETDGTMVPYRDSIEFTGDGWIMRSAVKGEDGEWQSFMEMNCRRA
jgi:hypothetical protein